MQLVRFAIQKYRSISKTAWLPLSKLTTLVGPNNEGKSNVLMGLRTVLSLVEEFPEITLRRGRITAGLSSLRELYQWKRDYPVVLQASNPTGESSFDLEFQLNTEELANFKTRIKSNLNGVLPIRITIGKSEPSFKVLKQGKGASALTKKSEEIARFIGNHLEFKYVPAVRTAETSQTIVEAMVARELREIERSDEFKKSVRALLDLQQPVLDSIALNVEATIKEFVQDVKGISLKTSEEQVKRLFRQSCQVVVDDGTPTNLEQKGDGIQSLVALSLMRFSSEKSAQGRSLMLAIEEPESHLHPNAIHKLKKVLYEISEKHQLIITTHNPVLVNREHISSNILVENNKATPASRIQEVRDILGVRASDNLRSADLVLVVEGEDDRKAISSILSHYSNKLKTALSDSRLAVDSLSGGTNLNYKLSMLRDSLCSVHCFLDHDDTGIESAKNAVAEGLILEANINYAICQGFKESEFEDLLHPNLYEAYLKNQFGVKLQSNKFHHNKKKWSERLRDLFLDQGKTWNSSTKAKIKFGVAECAENNPSTAINLHHMGPLQNLIDTLEEKLGT